MTKEQYIVIASKKFDYLCKDFNFAYSNPYPYKVIYKTLTYAINICYDYGRSFEITCFCSDNNGRGNFTLSEILRIKNKHIAEKHAFFQATEVDGVSTALEAISCVVRSDVLEIMKENDIFTKLQKQQENDCIGYQLEVNYRAIKSDSEDAWKREEYENYIKMLEPFVSILSQSDKEKIKYANRQLRAK